MSETIFSTIGAIVVIAAVVILVKGVCSVEQGYNFIVQRLGKYHKTLQPGLNFIVPFIDQVSYKVSTKDIVLDVPTQEVITKDNAMIMANAVAYINILEPRKAVYGVESYPLAIQTLVQTTLRSIVGEMDLDEATSSRDMIKARLKDSIAADIAEWGINLKTVEIQDISPSGTMQSAMEEQAAAERARRATITRAAGQKEAQILEAQGKLEASKLEAQAQVVLAEASQLAIQKVNEAIGSNDLPVIYLLGERYIEALGNIAASKESKTVVLPADLPAAIKGMLGK